MPEHRREMRGQHTFLPLLACLTAASPAAGQDPQPGDDPDVFGAHARVSVTPVQGVGIERDRIPNNVQVMRTSEPSTDGLPGVLEGRAAGVARNDVQNNPMQPDLSFRGFSASPLLGTPQGIAIYQNGTRLNEPFGDVVQWDLIPEFAIEEVQLIPGASPVYGLNALGGSVALRMRSGFDFQGLRLRSSSGSFRRSRGLIEHGQQLHDWAVYEALEGYDEIGWRDHSESHAGRMYADVRNRTPDQTTAFNLTLASTHLTGNGPVPVDLLRRRRESVFTYPDITDNLMLMLAMQTDRRVTDQLSVQANLYARHLGRDTFNGDEAEFDGLEGFDDVEDLDGLLHRTRTAGLSHGGSLQSTLQTRVDGHDNQLVLGVSVDRASVRFEQTAEAGRIAPDRRVLGEGRFVTGPGFSTLLDNDTSHVGIYATNTFGVTDDLFVTLSGRGNLARMRLDDPQGTALDGKHEFARVNPAAGVSYRIADALTLFASYTEGNRAPSAAELACADPTEPCRVPNAFLADPPLRQVVNRGVEIGGRGSLWSTPRAGVRYNVAGFFSRNLDDIIFVAGERIGTGFFQNAGETQRLGAEAGIEGRVGQVDFYANYQLTVATFENTLTMPGDNHPRAVIDADGRSVIFVQPGDRIPSVPGQVAKLGARVTLFDRLRVGFNGHYSGSQTLRGDEANLLDPLEGYVTLGARIDFQLLPPLTLFVEGHNLLDGRHETFGILGDGQEVLDFAQDPRFVGPGEPRGIWGGFTLHL